VWGVPTSEDTARLAREVGIPLIDLPPTPLDLTVDGADEVDPDLNMIKGFGGALVRERIVAAASRRQVILVTADKLVPRLGARGRLPVEVIPFARPVCETRLAALGCRPAIRLAPGVDSTPFVTDNHNLILDCGIDPIDDPAALERAIRGLPGVVDTGLFLGTADTVLVAEAGTVRALKRAAPQRGAST
ncbi:MAG: ribose 5-phosphate isomerase A, partial [Candidatus Rokuibacteriota bacterium]